MALAPNVTPPPLMGRVPIVPTPPGEMVPALTTPTVTAGSLVPLMLTPLGLPPKVRVTVAAVVAALDKVIVVAEGYATAIGKKRRELQAVRDAVRSSEEYKQKHPSVTPTQSSTQS